MLSNIFTFFVLMAIVVTGFSAAFLGIVPELGITTDIVPEKLEYERMRRELYHVIPLALRSRITIVSEFQNAVLPEVTASVAATRCVCIVCNACWTSAESPPERWLSSSYTTGSILAFPYSQCLSLK